MICFRNTCRAFRDGAKICIDERDGILRITWNNEDFAAELVVDFVYGRYGKRLHRNSNLMDDNISLIMIDLYHI